MKHQSGPPRPSPKPSSKAEASRQEVALPSRAVKLRSDGTRSSTNVLSNPVGGGGPRAQRVLDKKTGTYEEFQGPFKILTRRSA